MNINLKNKLIEPIADYMGKYEKVYYQAIHSDVKLINTVINYISRNKGKQLRPCLCILSAHLCGKPTDNTLQAASLIEMIHIATLIHDDVVDEADIQRGWPSINRVWKNKISILVGDYLLSKALTNMIYLKDFNALQILSKTAERLSRGEILQIEKAIKKNMDEDIYYKMVGDKTASLFSASCELGVLTVTQDEKMRRALAGFGEKFGLVFQIKDDLLDIMGNVDGLGKPAGFDLKKNILTLPLIHLFATVDPSKSTSLKRKLKHHVKRSELHEIRTLIKQHGGIEYAELQIKRLSEEAKNELNLFPDSIYKESLLSALDFNNNRIN